MNISALITSRNKPSVKTVSGSVSTTKIGFIVMLINIITAASMKPVQNVSMLIPDKKNSAINTAMPPKRILIRISDAWVESFILVKVTEFLTTIQTDANHLLKVEWFGPEIS